MKLSVLVFAQNDALFIDRCMASLQRAPSGCEFLVLDSGSSDGTSEELSKWSRRDPRVRRIALVQCTESDAINVGLSICRGTHVGFLPARNWLRAEIWPRLTSLATGEVALCGLRSTPAPMPIALRLFEAPCGWNVWLPRELVRQHQLKFEAERLADDYALSLEACLRARTVVGIGQALGEPIDSAPPSREAFARLARRLPEQRLVLKVGGALSMVGRIASRLRGDRPLITARK